MSPAVRPPIRRQDRVAANENEPQEIVAKLVVQRPVTIQLGRLLFDFELVAELLMLAFEQLVAAKDIDGPTLGGGHEPGTGIVRHAGARPLRERGNECVLGQFFGEADIAHHAR